MAKDKGGAAAGGGDELTGDGTGTALPPVEQNGDQEQVSEAADAEAEHRTAVDGMAEAAERLQLDTSALVFDVRDFLLEQIKQRPKPWSATSQAEQRDVAAQCEHSATELVRKVVEALAANGVDSIRVLLTKVNAGGDDIVITGKVKFVDEDPVSRDKSILSLHHAIGKHVMLTRATAEDYKQGGSDVDQLTDPDDPEFGFEGGGDDSDLSGDGGDE